MYSQIFKNTNYFKIVIAQIVNRLGDSIDAIAMSWLIFSLNNNSALTALNLGISFIPTVFIQPFAGSYVEKMNHKCIIVIMDVIRGTIVTIIAISTLIGITKDWMILIATFLLSTAEAFRIPAANAIIPSLVEKDNYSQALSLQASLTRVSELIGMGIAGIVIGALKIHGAIIIDALSFFVSASIILTIPTTSFQTTSTNSSVLKDFKSGLRYLKNSHKIFFFCIIGMAINALLTPINSLETVLCADIYQKNAQLLSLIGIATAIGSLLGAFSFPYLEKYIREKFLITVFLLLTGLFYLSCIFNVYLLKYNILFYTSIILFNFILGYGAAFMSAYASVNLLKKVDQTYLARVSALSSAICTGAIPVCSFIISILSVKYNVIVIFNIVAVLSLITGIMYLILRKEK